MNTAQKIITKLKLKPHPKEGGFFIETYRSKDKNKKRSIATAIYFFLTPKTFSSMHKLDSDEIFHFYAGDPVEILQLHPNGKGEIIILGNDVFKGMQPQVIVKKNVWQGSRLIKGGKFALLGTTVSPGFEYKDYHDGDKEILIKKYPRFKKIISALTR
jgi:hypothetical protein